MKICVIGCGNHSAFVHGPSWKRYAGMQADTLLAACCDIDEASAAWYARENGFRTSYADYAQMLSAEKPDLVDIVMPVHVTERVTLDVVGRGFPCLVEKPPATTPEGVHRIIDASEKAGVQVRVAFNRRFIPLTQVLMKMLGEHPQNKVQCISYDMHRFHRGGEEFSTTALHGIDMVRYVAQADYAKVDFAYDSIRPDTSNIYLHGTMTSGTVVRLSFLPDTGRAIERIGIHTSVRSYFLDIPVLQDDTGVLTVYENNSLLARFCGSDLPGGREYGVLGGFYDEIASFADLLRNGGTDTVSNIRQSLQSVEMAWRMQNRASNYCA